MEMKSSPPPEVIKQNNVLKYPFYLIRRLTFYKQRDGHFFSTLTYFLSIAFIDVPFVLLETIIFVSSVYWLAGMKG